MPEPTLLARYRRLQISWEDLRDASESCERMLQIDEFEDPSHAIRKSADFKAHLTQLVVAYARPFTRHHSSDQAEESLSGVREHYSEVQEKLHERLIELRNKEFCHADPQPAGLKISVNRSWAVPVHITKRVIRYHSLSREDVERLEGMLEILTDALRSEIRELEEELPEGNHG